MHARKVLHKLLESTCPWMHSTRRIAVEAVVLSAINGSDLTVTDLGRSIISEAKEKHCIKRADRLLSNPHFQSECFPLYANLARLIVGSTQRPVILVDWSDLDGARKHYLLRASVPVDGRSLTLYEEVHGKNSKDKPRTHRQFLKRLNEDILPPDCQPIMVTDAGFRGPWFQAVERIGWDWVGRVLNRTHLQLGEESEWKPHSALYSQACGHEKSLGAARIARSNPVACELVIFKEKSKGRHNLTRSGKQAKGGKSVKNASREIRPWLLATSLSPTYNLPKRVVKLYRLRMQIEEAFRDIKSHRYGLGFAYNRTHITKRLSVLLVIGHLALIVLWMIGKATELTDQARQYQANTVTHRRVLSTVFIGRKVVNDCRVRLKLVDIKQAAFVLQDIIENSFSI